jgi:DNA-3-methyladenine glycosylase
METDDPRAFLARPSYEVAPELLGSILEHQTAEGLVAVRLTEIEAYDGANDSASHAYRGQTPRNAVMFGPPGYAYVYFTYGMHFCVNVVCQVAGIASAVLLRAGEVITGEELARARRPSSKRVADLASGPARLCQALAIDRALDGADLFDPVSPLRLRLVAPVPVAAVAAGPRGGISTAIYVPWRFWLAGEPSVSAYRPHVPKKRKPVTSSQP